MRYQSHNATEWKDVAESGWQGCRVYQHSSTVSPAGHQITSTSHARSRTRDGTSVLVYLEHNGRKRPFIAIVDYFLRITHQQLPTQRLAISSLYDYQAPKADKDLADMVIEFDMAAGYGWTEFPVPLQHIAKPCNKMYRKVHGTRKVAYVPFSFTSGM